MMLVGNNEIILAILGRCNPSWLQINPSVSLNKIAFIRLASISKVYGRLCSPKQKMFKKKNFKGSIDYQKLVLQMSFILTINDAKTRKCQMSKGKKMC